MVEDVRKNKRAPVSLKVRFKSATVDEFIEQYSADISKGGIFIKSKQPMPPGTLLKFEFQLKDNSPLIQGVGRVVWKRDPESEGWDLPPGMGIKFIKMDERSRAVVERIVSGKEIVDEGDGPPRGTPVERGERPSIITGHPEAPPSQAPAPRAEARPQELAEPRPKRDSRVEAPHKTVPSAVALHDALAKALASSKAEAQPEAKADEREEVAAAPAEEPKAEAQPEAKADEREEVAAAPAEEPGPEPLPAAGAEAPREAEPPPEDLEAQERAKADLEAAAASERARQARERAEREARVEGEARAERAEPPRPSRESRPSASGLYGEEERPSTWIWVGAIAILVIAVVAGVIYMTRERRRATESLEQATLAPESPSEEAGVRADGGTGPAAEGGAPTEEVVQLRITSEPSGAEVLVDSERQSGTTPIELSGLPTDGDLTIEARLQGYQPASKRVRPGEELQVVALKLQPMDRRVILVASTKAVFSVDGERAGYGNSHTFEKAALPLKVTIEAPRHKLVEVTIGEDSGPWNEVDGVLVYEHPEIALDRIVSETRPPQKIAPIEPPVEAPPGETAPAKAPEKAPPETPPEKAPAETPPETPPEKAPPATIEENPYE